MTAVRQSVSNDEMQPDRPTHVHTHMHTPSLTVSRTNSVSSLIAVITQTFLLLLKPCGVQGPSVIFTLLFTPLLISICLLITFSHWKQAEAALLSTSYLSCDTINVSGSLNRLLRFDWETKTAVSWDLTTEAAFFFFQPIKVLICKGKHSNSYFIPTQFSKPASSHQRGYPIFPEPLRRI